LRELTLATAFSIDEMEKAGAETTRGSFRGYFHGRGGLTAKTGFPRMLGGK